MFLESRQSNIASQESLRQTKPKKGPKRKVHEFRPFFGDTQKGGTTKGGVA